MSLIDERRGSAAERHAVRSRAGGDPEAAEVALLQSGGGGRRHVSLEGFSFSSGGAVGAVAAPSVAPARPVAEAAPLAGDVGTMAAADILRARGGRWVRLQGQGAPSRAYLVTKRLFDIIVALGALLVLIPLLLLVGLAIVLEDGGPVLYCQTRIGRDGKPFRFYKFRSMIRNADAVKDQLAQRNEASGPIFKMKNDPRITRIGRILRRSSIDELPQLLNVLRGEMSVVGPRPHLPREVALYAPRQERRLSVQPGLVCLREVCGRSNLTFDQWVELDLLYIENRSLRMDLGVLLRLVPAVLRGEGAY